MRKITKREMYFQCLSFLITSDQAKIGPEGSATGKTVRSLSIFGLKLFVGTVDVAFPAGTVALSGGFQQ